MFDTEWNAHLTFFYPVAYYFLLVACYFVFSVFISPINLSTLSGPKLFRFKIFGFLVKKKAQGKITRNLSSPVLEKFNGYEVIRNSLSSKEREEFVPINVVYESIYDENVPVPCYFTNEIHLAYRSYIGKLDNGNERMTHRTVRQCCYSQNFFSKTEESLKIHMSTCGDVTSLSWKI